MAQFYVVGTDASGKNVRVKVEATSEQHARERMGRRNVTVISVEAAEDGNAIVKAASPGIPADVATPGAVVVRAAEQPPAKMPAELKKWTASGFWKDDGHAGTLEVTAATQREAEQLATTRGLLVELVVPTNMAQPTPPPIPVAAAVVQQPSGPQVVYMQAPSAPIQNVVNVTNVVGVTSGRSFSRGTAALLSLLLPGLGQMYKGQIINGVCWLIVVIAGYAFFIFPGVILHILCVLGAMSGSRR